MKSLFFRVLLLSAFSISQLFAATSAPVGLSVIESSDTTISLDWDDTESAVGYYVYYGTQSPEDRNYEVQGVDLIESSDFVIDGVSPSTQYFISVTAVDEFGAESAYAEELTYRTKENGSITSIVNFRIQEVEVVNSTDIELVFSENLDVEQGAIRNFVIEDVEQNLELTVKSSQVASHPQKLYVVLQDSLTPEREYKVTILDIKDSDGNSIEAGIDGFISFTTPQSFRDEENINLPAAPEQVVEDPVSSESNDDLLVDNIEGQDVAAQAQDTPDTQIDSGDNGGVKLTQEDLGTTTTQTATQADKLPQTGPEHWLLLILTILITGGVYLFLYTQTVWRK